MPIYAADVQAIAESITALTVVGAVGTWTFRTSRAAVSRLRRRRHKQLVQVLSNEMASGPGWDAVSASPEVSLEAGIAYARAAAATGYPPYVVTRGAVSSDDPPDYLLDKVAETVWEAVSSANSELSPYLRPMQNYLAALAGSAGTEPARDFALGVLTERVRQEEDGWPDQPHDQALYFFARARWELDQLGLAVAQLTVLLVVPPGPDLQVAVDDSVFRRSGRKVHGARWQSEGS